MEKKLKNRVESDLRQFEESIAQVEGLRKRLPAKVRDNLQRARNYYNDSKYFLKEGDLPTAWGTINYAHGILDAMRKQLGLECYGALE